VLCEISVVPSGSVVIAGAPTKLVSLKVPVPFPLRPGTPSPMWVGSNIDNCRPIRAMAPPSYEGSLGAGYILLRLSERRLSGG